MRGLRGRWLDSTSGLCQRQHTHCGTKCGTARENAIVPRAIFIAHVEEEFTKLLSKCGPLGLGQKFDCLRCVREGVEKVVRSNTVWSDVRTCLLAALLEFGPELEELLDRKANARFVTTACVRECCLDRAHATNRAGNLHNIIARCPRRVVGDIARLAPRDLERLHGARDQRIINIKPPRSSPQEAPSGTVPS